MTTGIGAPFSSCAVRALKSLQNAMMLRPRWPSAGPIGGDGLAAPAGTCSLRNPATFFATDNVSCYGPTRSPGTPGGSLSPVSGADLGGSGWTASPPTAWVVCATYRLWRSPAHRVGARVTAGVYTGRG